MRLNSFFRNSFLSRSYFLNYTKVVIINSGFKHLLLKLPDNVYVGFGDTTYYGKNAQIDKKKFFGAFKKLKIYLQHKSNNNFAILLFPAPSEMYGERLENIAKISNFNVSDIDRSFKYDLILQACVQMNITCLDTVKILHEKDFYKYDNHPNSLGTEKIANFLNNKFSTLIK